MNKKLLSVAVFGVIIVAGGVFALMRGKNNQPNMAEQKTPHFESSTPAASSKLAAMPPNVTIDFNFDLANGSTIDILKDGKSFASGETTIDDNKLAMRRDISRDAPDGAYTVAYKACWPDGSCHDGRFSFTLDRAMQASFMDLTGRSEVTIRMSQIAFSPMEVRVSKGTKVTWVNDDEAVHYVNTDAHPSHTHTPELNSRALNKGDSYSHTFDKSGAFPYHCSAHASSMTGTVIVE